MPRLPRAWIPLLLALFMGGLYLRTLAPGLTWAHDGADGGDLVTAAATGGVPHPTGYPVYLALASLFLKIPFGSLAWRGNLLSAVCTVLAALVIRRTALGLGMGEWAGALVALFFGTFPLVWSQAVITEVNAVNGLVCALVLYLLLVPKPGPRTDLLAGLVCGLSLGVHMTGLFLLPPLFLTINKSEKWKSLLRRAASLLAGAGAYLILLLRAAHHAPVNWGRADGLSGLLWLVSGRLYQGRLTHFDPAYLWSGFQKWCSLLLNQPGWVGLLLVFFALAFLVQRSRPWMITLWVFLAYSSFSILYYSPDSYVYLIAPLLCLSIWIGMAASSLSQKTPLKWRPVLLVSLVFLVLLRALWMIPGMDLSRDTRAEDFVQAVFQSAPRNAVIITSGDEATFALWYGQYVLHLRPDLALVCADLMAQPWYAGVLNDTYPDLLDPKVPRSKGILFADNSRTVCHVSIDEAQPVRCAP